MKCARCGFCLAHGNSPSRRSHLRYDRSACKLFRRPRGRFRRRIRSRDSPRRRSNCGGLNYPCMLNLLWIYLDVSPGHRLTILERIPRNSGNRSWRILVHVGAVHHSRSIHHRGVVDIHHFGPVDHPRIRYVDPGYIHFARAVRRHPHVARPQRKPRHSNSGGTAKLDRCRGGSSPNERHQRRRIHRPLVHSASYRNRPRDPTPTTS